jgi:predicted MFS family arabinose efflux permease
LLEVTDLSEDPEAVTTSQRPLARSLVLIMATATGLAVANNYYAQPLLPEISKDLHLSGAVAGLIVTVAQIGYALGLVFLLPLGDLRDRRKLLVVMSLVLAVALGVLAAAPTAGVLLPAAVAVGALSVQAQILVPFAATLASDEERGRVVGTVMSGLLLGILLARTVAGLVAQAGSWRIVYVAAAAAMLVQGATLAAKLPTVRLGTALSYPGLLRSVLDLARQEPLLRLRSAYGAMSFGAFSVLWTSMAFLLAGSPYHYGPATIGLFGLVGAAGAAMASIAGRLADRGYGPKVTIATALVLVVSWLPILLGRHHIGWLIVGILLLDIGAQGLHITNQSEIYKLQPEARSRITSAYMTTYFIGGAVGSASSAAAWDAGGWSAVCAVGVAFCVIAVAIWATVGRRFDRPRAAATGRYGVDGRRSDAIEAPEPVRHG